MTESLHLTEDSDRYAAEVFDAQRAEILAFFLVGIYEDPADRVSQRRPLVLLVHALKELKSLLSSVGRPYLLIVSEISGVFSLSLS